MPKVVFPLDSSKKFTEQQIVLLEFDTRGREREVIVQIVGE